MMRKITCPLYLMVIALSIFFIPQAMAGPASPDPVILENPDGTAFKAMIRGDEFQHWIETEEGYSIVRNPANETWEYAEKAPDGSLQNSGVKFEPGRISPRKFPKGLRPDRNSEAEEDRNRALREIFQDRINAAALTGEEGPAAPGAWPPVPVWGQKKVLVILINFADRTLSTTPDGWYGKIFDTTVGVKSMANYYKTNSYGMMTIYPIYHMQTGNPAGIITVTVSDNHPNYGGNYVYGTETTILNHALAQAATYINFYNFDSNRNGVIEQSEISIYFIYAGYERSSSSKTPNVWAHAWGGTPGLTAGTRQVQHWAQSGELNDSSVQHPMGIIAHEMGHSLCGLPDLYDTSNTNAGLGAFSLMASGNWGADTGEEGGITPVVLDAWSRQYLGWATPAPSPSPAPDGTITFPLPLAWRWSSVVLPVIGSEYFLAEIRYPTGWDLGMKRYMGSDWQGGLLILHVDINIGTPANNDINRSGAGTHQGVMAEEANNGVGCSLVNGTCKGSAGILFYAGNNNAFTDASSPNSRYYSGTPSGFGLSSISVPGQTITATYSASHPSVTANYPANNAVNVGTGTTISVTFNKAMEADTINSTNFHLNNGVTGSVNYNPATYTATFTPSARLEPNTIYTATVTTDVTDAAGIHMLLEKTWSFTTVDVLTLTINFAGSGSGTVTINPLGISCNVNCTNHIDSGSALNLHATHGDNSTFSDWSGDCSGGGDCAMTMNTDKDVTSTFTSTLTTFPPVRVVGGGYYDSFQPAYIAAAASCTILAKAVELPGDFTLNLGKTVLVRGGYDSVYSSNSGGYSVINGTLTILSGSLTIENLIIE